MDKKLKIKQFINSGLYLVSSQELSNVSTLVLLKEALKAGCSLFQLREKTLSKKEYYKLALEAKKIVKKHNALLIINDHVDIAKIIDADGVHLGLDDLPIDAARKILGENFIIGASTHNTEEVKTAIKQGADYINIGPIFDTLTKPDTYAIGNKGLEQMLSHVTVPFTLMGGIKESNINDLKRYKPSAFAMITEVSRSYNIKDKVEQLIKKIK